MPVATDQIIREPIGADPEQSHFVLRCDLLEGKRSNLHASLGYRGLLASN